LIDVINILEYEDDVVFETKIVNSYLILTVQSLDSKFLLSITNLEDENAN